MIGSDVADEAGRPVAIHLATYIVQGGDVSNFNFDLRGRLFQIGRTIYLRFMEDDHHDGHAVPITIKIDGAGHVKLTRSGGNHLRLIFIRGKQVDAYYRTPYGMLSMKTVTPELAIRYRNQPFSGALKINYKLYAQQQLLGRYQLRLQFTV